MKLLETSKTQITQATRILMGGQRINLRARQMIYALAAMMDTKSPTDPIKIPAHDFLRFVNTKGKKWSDVHLLINDIFEHLNANPILVRVKGKKDFAKINWLSSLGIYQGVITGRLSPDIADYFVYQGLQHTKVLWDLRIYESAHTARILDLLQRYHNHDQQTEFIMSVDELKLFFGVHDKYKRFSDFKRRVLDTARDELYNNIECPYYFEYEPLKTKGKRGVDRVQFTIYTRDAVLQKLIPSYLPIRNDGNPTLGSSPFLSSLTEEQTVYYHQLIKLKVKQPLVQYFLENYTRPQVRAMIHLIQYGVNPTLAKNLVKDHCSFGEILGNEDQYVIFCLHHIEKDRLKRIEDNKSGKSKKRITPKEKRGGLPKDPITKRYYFSAYIEKLSNDRKHASQQKRRASGENKNGFEGLGDILKDKFNL